MEKTSKRKRNGEIFLRTAIAAVASSMFSTGVVYAQEDASEPSADTILVTGSRIKRSAVEGAVPIAVIERAEIDRSGQVTVADFLRNLSFNSFGSYRETSGNTFQGQGLVSLRGLGSERTLVLIDGRRIPPSPVTQGTGVDLNTLPLVAVERVEVLTDGASAVYGSDAIGGVINIILRKDYNGAQLSYGIERPSRDGADGNSAAATVGVSNDKTSFVFGVNHYKRNPIFDRDRPYTAVDLGDGQNFSTTNGLSLFGNTFLRLDDYTVQPGPNCDASRELRPYTEDVFGLGGTLCSYAFGNISANVAALEANSVFANGIHEITDDHRLLVTSIFSKSESFGRYAPVPDAVLLEEGSANNVFGVDGYLYHRFQQLGPRDNTNSSYLFSQMVAFQGDLPFGSRVEYEVGARFSRYNFVELGRNYLLRSVARQYLADGTYNPYDPSQNSEDVLNRMRVTINRDGIYKYWDYFASVNFDAFKLPAGVVGVALGAEYRTDDFADLYDPQSEAGAVGGSSGNSAVGSRNARAFFGEAVVPILENLEAQLAVRYDDYSIGGDATSPKIGLRYTPIDWLTFRGSWGTGFRVPTFSDLFAKPTFSAEFARDLVACEANGLAPENCPLSQFNTTIFSNPELEPEESSQFSVGFLMSPTNWLDIKLDYYNIKLEDSITGYSVQELINREFAGQPLPEGTAINRRANGSLASTETGTFNVAEIKTDGIDLDIATRFSFGAFGSLATALRFSYVMSYEDSSVSGGADQVGAGGYPEFRAVLDNTWTWRDLSFVWYVDYIDSTIQLTEIVPGDTRPKGHVASATYHHFQLNYTTPWQTMLTVGVRNAFDRDPSLNPLESTNFDTTLYDPYGRVPYFKITQDF